MQVQTNPLRSIKRISALLFPEAETLKEPLVAPEKPALEELGGEDRPSKPGELRFQIIFYTLAALTGLVAVQLIWQIAILTIPPQ